MAHYAQIYNFGPSVNKNITDINNTTNPLTYCTYQNYNSKFLHGSSASIYSPQSVQCQSYLADRCGGMMNKKELWDNYCQANYDINKQTFWPNSGAISAEVYNQVAALYSFGLSDHLLRNSCERHFLKYPNVSPNREPFDPSNSASPFYNNYSAEYGPLKYTFKNLDKKTLDKNPLMNKVLKSPLSSTDILARIYHHMEQGNINIKGTKLQKFLKQNKRFYAQWYYNLFVKPYDVNVTYLQNDNQVSYLKQC